MKSFNFFFIIPTTPDRCINEEKHRLTPGKVLTNGMLSATNSWARVALVLG